MSRRDRNNMKGSTQGNPDSADFSAFEDPDLLRRLEEYCASLEQDQHAQREQLLADFPNVAGQVAAYLDALEFVQSNFGAPDAKSTERILGDYRILDEIGRGGMGIVYQAQQISLNRRVAVKVLLGAAALSPRQLQRFKNEAQAAASLDHPHIVKIYSVGCEHGVHFYAMQLIEGRTLADVIRELARLDALAVADPHATTRTQDPASPTPCAEDLLGAQQELRQRREPQALVETAPQPRLADTRPSTISGSTSSSRNPGFFRRVAHLGIQAAEALEHAHRMGIVHRDIKPSNLLLDIRGQLWVTDFGLARTGAESDMTMTGDIVGTLRYMSPEQASAGRQILDQHTDIYSLGATLYELLTLRPPFPEEDRHALLRQLAEAEPLPLRRLHRAVPRDLETIVLKCLAKDPQARYASADALAHDLHRFLRDEPIRARRPSLATRMARWARRHRPLVWTGAAALLLAFAGLLVSNWMIASQRTIAQRERERAEINFRKARDAVDRVFILAAEQMIDKPHMEPVRRLLLENALAFYQGFLLEKSDDPSVRHETAMTYYRVGYSHVLLGQYEKCIEPLKHAASMLEELVKENPRSVEYRVDLAQPYAQLAYACMWNAHIEDAATFRKKRLALYEQLDRDYPQDPKYLRKVIQCQSDLGALFYNAFRPAEGIQYSRRALALCQEERNRFASIPQDRPLVAHVHHWLGALLHHLNQFPEAEEHYRKAIDLRTRQLAETPDDITLKHDLTHAQTYLAELLMNTSRVAEAVPLFQKVVAADDEYLAGWPEVGDYRRCAGRDYELLGRSLAILGRWAEAETAMRRSLDIRIRYADDTPEISGNLSNVAWTHAHLGEILEKNGRRSESAVEYRKAIDLFSSLVAKDSKRTRYQESLTSLLVTCPIVELRDPPRAIQLIRQTLQHEPKSAEHWGRLGVAQYVAGDWQAALDSLEKARELSNGGTAELWVYLAMAHAKLGHPQLARTWLDKAVAWLKANRVTAEEYDSLRSQAEAVLKGAPTGTATPR